MTLAEAIVTTARKYKGVTEVGGNTNDGPEIRQWLAFVNVDHPASYCAAFACSVVHEARTDMAMGPLLFKKSASALHLLEINQALTTTDPQPGDLIIFDHGHGLGHVAIKTGPNTSIAGNTSPDGKSREGTGVFEHGYDPQDPKIAGYIRAA